MIKKTFYQNSKYAQELIQTFESDFVFGEKTLNRIKISEINAVKKDQLVKLSERINSIEDCSLKMNSKNIVMGDGNVDGPIMLIGEAPGLLEDKVGKPFQGDLGSLLNKMLLAINIKREKIYITYALNFRPPEDRKPLVHEIRKYSEFLKEHISIIDPKIIILMGSTAMEAVIRSNEKISETRGKWKEIILKNKTYPIMVTFSPSYLLRFPDKKKFSWEDLKNLRQKIRDLKINI
tara:strand:+ start:744 stop:1448 length:705 start_codon:yes stop_codon:yes gene_type:complete